jgi:hypothetical protein
VDLFKRTGDPHIGNFGDATVLKTVTRPSNPTSDAAEPTTTSTIQVGSVAFKSRAEAESGMQTIKVCETR